MLPKVHRLPRNVLRRVLSEGKRYAQDILEYRVIHNKNNEPWRASIVVSTRIDKRAVYRNRIRRILSEELRLTPKTMLGVDFVVIVKKRGNNDQTFHSFIHSLVSTLPFA